MRVSLTPDSAAISPTATAETLSPWARAFAIFARPASAWVGLETRAQWWFPLLIVTTVAVAGTAALQNRAIIPMQAEAMEQQLQSGSMSPAQVQKMEDFLASPGGYALTVVPQIIFVPAFALLIALVIWFGVGFVLGSPMKYRHALEVACWANLVQLPGIPDRVRRSVVPAELQGRARRPGRDPARRRGRQALQGAGGLAGCARAVLHLVC